MMGISGDGGVPVHDCQLDDRSGDDQHPSDAVPPRCRPTWISDELIQATIEVWQPLLGHTVTPDEAVEILQNVGRLADFLEN